VDVPLPLGSWIVPDLSYQLLTSHHCNCLRVRIILRLAAYHQSVLLGAKQLETHDQYFFQLDTSDNSPYVTSSLTRELIFVYNCCWPSPTQSFSGPSSARLMSIFYSLRFETPQNLRARSPYEYLYPPGIRCPSYTPRHWLPFSSPPMTRRTPARIAQKTSLPLLRVLSLPGKCPHSCYLTTTVILSHVYTAVALGMGLHVTICIFFCPTELTCKKQQIINWISVIVNHFFWFPQNYLIVYW
jgi:hypothetical protein